MPEYPSFVGLLISDVVPILSWLAVDLAVLDNVVVIYKVGSLEVVRTDRSRIAKSKRPVSHGSRDRLPYTVLDIRYCWSSSDDGPNVLHALYPVLENVLSLASIELVDHISGPLYSCVWWLR